MRTGDEFQKVFTRNDWLKTFKFKSKKLSQMN